MSGPSDRLSGSGVVAERLLLREFSHRVNDELASHPLDLGGREPLHRNEARALDAVQHRLQGYAEPHHSLQMPEYTTTIVSTAYLCQLCRAISRSELESEGIELSLAVYPLRMDSEGCWLLGMIVYELVTNAARDASHDAEGSIHLEVRPAGASIECCVTGNGSSATKPLRGQGLATVQALAAGLHATVDMQSGPNGTRTVLNFSHTP